MEEERRETISFKVQTSSEFPLFCSSLQRRESTSAISSGLDPLQSYDSELDGLSGRSGSSILNPSERLANVD
jgi:hypothetical protein